MEELECKGCGRFFIPGKGGEMIVEGCPNCGRPLRDQPNPTISDEEMIWKEMPAAAADGGYGKDMSGNPLQEGILADGGWQNRKVRDETVGSTKETFEMEPYEPWWHQSAEEHTIDADAEIESVMPPTDTDSPTVEAKLMGNFPEGTPAPGWHNGTTFFANRSLTDHQPPLVIDGEQYSEELGRELQSKYMGPDYPPKTFMISHPDEVYLEAMKEYIETGRGGKAEAAMNQKEVERQLKEAEEWSANHGGKHAIHDGEIHLPNREERGHFHDDHEALSRALYATQAHTFGNPYLSHDQERQPGIKATHQEYGNGASSIPVSTSHPELVEILQRVADFDSLDPLIDWLEQAPDLTEDQRAALMWMANQKIIEKQASPLAPELMNNITGPLLANPGGMTQEEIERIQNAIRNLPETPEPKVTPQAPKVPTQAPQAPVEPPAPKPSGGGNLIGDAAETVAEKGPSKALPKVLGPLGLIDAIDTVSDATGLTQDLGDKSLSEVINDPGAITTPGGGASNVPKWLVDKGQKGLEKGIQTGMGLAGEGLSDMADQAKDFGKGIGEVGKGFVDSLTNSPPQTEITPPAKTEPEKGGGGIPPIPIPPVVPGIGGKGPSPKQVQPQAPQGEPNAKKAPAPAGGSGSAKQPPENNQKTQEKTRGRNKPRLKIPDLGNFPTNYNIGLPPMSLLTHVEEIRNRMIKRAEREDAKEHPSTHSEIPANDITNPDEIDPRQKKDGDMSDWQKDFSVNDIGGARQDPGAVVVTVQSDRPEDFDIKEIADVLGVDKNSESVKMITDFWDHFMDILDNPHDEAKQNDPILSLLGELLGNERGHGRKK